MDLRATSRLSVPIMLLGLLGSGCSVFELDEYRGFWDWYIGPAGIDNMMGGADSRKGLRCKRPWIYGHFRSLEVAFQPAGWFRYPERVTSTNDALFSQMGAAGDNMRGYSGTVWVDVSTIRTSGAQDSLHFDWFDAGLVEIIPYRTWTSDEEVGYKIGMTALQPLNALGMAFWKAFYTVPADVVHDALKTCTIPVAAVYYAVKASGSKAPPAKWKPPPPAKSTPPAASDPTPTESAEESASPAEDGGP